jgi:4-hydroxybenzoate polyprenyltransferase
VAYDTEYAMVDRPDDLKIGIRTSAITFGRFDVAAVMLCYASAFALLGAAGVAAGRGVPFFAGLGAAAGIAAYHYTLIRERDRLRCFRAFLHNNWVGAAIFAGLAADYLLFPPQ